jgi:hypothetical protein
MAGYAIAVWEKERGNGRDDAGKNGEGASILLGNSIFKQAKLKER